jgi:large subunit ribosomal protein L10|tara:strand:- start:17 stop:544 length:528 start_codon:yes stop_codon:yes gene_type:complete
VPIGLKEKQAIVAEVNETAQAALSAVMADYRGVTVDAMTQLRKSARESGVQVRVIRNTLAKRAFEGTELECMNEALTGPCIVAFAMEDPGASARLFKDFAKEQEAFEIKALSVGGKLLPAEQIDALAKLPTRDEALALLMAVMQAPVTKLVRTMNDIPGRVTRVVAAVRDQKQAA